MLIMGLQRRFEQANRPVTVRMTLPLATVLRVEGVARQLRLSRRRAIEAAVGEWSVRNERALNRRRRLVLERSLREAGDGRPVQDILADFAERVLTDDTESYTNPVKRPRGDDAPGARTQKAGSVPATGYPDAAGANLKFPSGPADRLGYMGEKKETQVLIRMSDREHQALRQLAEKEHRTVSAHIRFLIERDAERMRVNV